MINSIFLKKYLLITALACFSTVSISRTPLATQKQIGLFLNSTTCIVLENGINPYNMFIKDAVEKHWKATPYEFINQAEFEIRRSDSKYSFLVLIKSVYDKDPGGVSYNYINLVLGGDSKNMTNMPEFCSVPLLYSDDGNLDYEYALPAIVKFIQKHTKSLENNRFLISIRGLKYHNSSGFRDMQLLMNKDKMAPDASTIEKISTTYPYFVKLLSSTEIKEEISANPKNALFHFHVGPNKDVGVGKCFEMIFDVDGNLYYYNSRKITNSKRDGFTLKDFRHIR